MTLAELHQMYWPVANHLAICSRLEMGNYWCNLENDIILPIVVGHGSFVMHPIFFSKLEYHSIVHVQRNAWNYRLASY